MKKIIFVIMAGLIASSLVAAAQAPQAVTPAAAPVAVTPAPSPAVKALTYDECLAIAEEKNRDFAIAKLDKDIAEAQLQKAAGNFGPSIALMGGYQPYTKLSYINIPAGVFGPSAVSFPMGAQTYYSARLSLSQPVFTFGKTYFGFQMANEGYRIASINYKKATEKLKLDVISAFYGALITKQLYQAQEESYKSTEEYLRITKTKYANGQASNFELLQAQVQLANAKPDLLRAKDGSTLALQALKNTLAMPLDEPLDIQGEPEYKKLTETYGDIRKRFKENNDDKEIVEAAANIAANQRNLAVAMLLPNIALSANYSYYTYDPAFHAEKNYWNSSWDVTIGMQWQIFDGFKTEAGIKEASANEAKQKLSKQNADNMLSIQLDSLFMTLDESGQVIEAADELIKSANEGYRIAKESYRNGLIQSVDLMNAEIMLMRAKINYLNALNNYITSMQKLKNFLE